MTAAAVADGAHPAAPPHASAPGAGAHSDRLALLAVTLLALALRLHLLAEQSVWWDEGLAAWAARQDLASIARWTSSDVHPPLYFWLLHAWRSLAGESAFALRLLSVFAGVLLVPLAGALGRYLGGRRAGIAAAALVAIAPFLLWWSQEMRMYELAALLATLSITLTIRLTAGEPMSAARRRMLWLAYVAVTAAALYTLYLAVLVVLLEGAYVVLWAAATPQRRRELLGWAAATAATLALFLPWLAYAVGRMRTWSSAAPWSGAQFARVYVALLSTGASTHVERYALPSLLFVAVALVAIGSLLAVRGRRQWPQITLLLACLLVLPVAVFALTLSRGLFYTPNVEARYLLLFAPAVYTLLAWGLAVMKRPMQAVCAVILVALAAAGVRGHYAQRYLDDDYQTLVATLRSYAQPGDAVILHSDSDWPVFAFHDDGDWLGIPYGETATAASVAARLAATAETSAAVWLVVTPDALRVDGPGHVEAYLQQKLPRRAEYTIGDKRLVLFARSDLQRAARTTAATHRLQIDLGGGVTLVGYEQALRRVRPGERVYAAVYWRGPACSAVLPLTVVHAQRGLLASAPSPLCDRASSGDVHRALLTLAVAADWPAGVCELRSGETVLGRLDVLPATASASAAADIAHPLAIDFDGKVTLRGYDIEPVQAGALQAGGKIRVMLYWQAQQPLDRSYTAFVHLLGQTYNARSANFLWGQHDSTPAAGAAPTTSWRVGALIADEHIVAIDAGAPAGTYQVEVGLYDAVSPPYPRLAVRNAQGAPIDDRVIVDALHIER